jgi:hypothetical protein
MAGRLVLPGGASPLPGCALLVAHWTVLIIFGFVVTIILIPMVVIVLGVLSITVPPEANELMIFGVYVPLVTAVSLAAARRVNHWIDARVGLPAPVASRDGAADFLPRLAEIDAKLAPRDENSPNRQ